MAEPVYGLIEAGGTKFMLATANAGRELFATARIDTTTPEATLGEAVRWFRAQAPRYAAIGIASFGPLDLDPASPDWGHVRQTPKPHWSGADLASPFRDAFACPIAVDTDVNGAALAEALWGAGQGQRASLYFTVGTGIGGGAVIDGELLRGLTHPEMGHVRVARHPDDRDYAGRCPFHGDCLEGLASGPAILDRWGASLSDLPSGHPGPDIIAWYLGQLVANLQAIFEPGRIIFGGGVTATPGLIDRIRDHAAVAHGGYFLGDPRAIVSAPALGDRAGLMGALALALGVSPDAVRSVR